MSSANTTSYIPNYSDDAQLSRGLILSSHLDLNIYVEDNNKEYLYEYILIKLLPEYDFNKLGIYPQGGKNGVIKAYKEFGVSTKGTPNFFIVDADFDVLLNKIEVNTPHFIYLEKYNIESYLFDIDSILSYLSCSLEQRRVDLHKILDIHDWYSKTIQEFSRLFLVFALVADKDLPYATIKTKYTAYIDDKGNVCPDKVDSYIRSIKQEVSTFDEDLDKVKKQFKSNLNEDATNLICGKFLIDTVCTYIRTHIKLKFSNKDFKKFLCVGQAKLYTGVHPKSYAKS